MKQNKERKKNIETIGTVGKNGKSEIIIIIFFCFDDYRRHVVLGKKYSLEKILTQGD